jgi:hypothetical protein
MIDFAQVMRETENIFKVNLGDNYNIERNPVRPADPFYINRNQKKGWIGLYRDSLDYELIAIGGMPWMVHIKILVEIQVAGDSAEDCEDKLTAAEQDVLELLENDRSLDNTIGTIKGYTITYDRNETEATFYQSALILVHGEIRQ